jgi:4'-phosphopantetheinyl transferase
MPTSRSSSEFLKPGQLFLWTVPTDDLNDAATACRLQQLLSADEQEEVLRFHRVADQNRFIISRSFVRLTLSQHFPVPTSEWRFDRDRNRKPFIVAPDISPTVQFSLSHTEGVVACLISLSAEAAVDVEKVVCSPDLPAAVEKILSLTEQRTLSARSGADWAALFFNYWTLKEAYAKARGLGLMLELRDIGFEFKSDNTIQAHFASHVDDDALDWVFWSRHLSAQHLISVAAKRDVSNECKIIHRPVKFDGLNIVPDA